MPMRINMLAGLVAALLLLAASAALADSGAESLPTDVDGRWIPSFSISTGVTMQFMSSSSESHCRYGRPKEAVQVSGTSVFVDRVPCRDPENALVPPPVTPGLFDPLCPDEPSPDGKRGCLRPNRRSDQVAVNPFVSGSLELASPRLGLLPGRPRAFVAGELLQIFAQRRDIAKEGSPSVIYFPQGKTRAMDLGQPAVLGQGTRVSSEVQRLGWSARGGLAFPFELLGRRLWLKPSFGWLRYQVDIETVMIAAIKDDPVNDVNAMSYGPGIREVSFSGSASGTYDSVGPGLELEMEAGRFGPLGVSLFMNGDAYWVLGERRVQLSNRLDCPAFDPYKPTAGCSTGLLEALDTNLPNVLKPIPEANIGADTYTARFTFGVSPVVYRGGLGIRFHWLGR